MIEVQSNMTSTIYQSLWNIDLQANGCTVSLRDQKGDWIDPNADILVDQQDEATRGVDQAPDPLFFQVNEDKLTGKTYTTFIKLLDNYVAYRAEPEDLLGFKPIEDSEIDDFLEAILDTKVMKAALDYINQLGNTFSSADLKSELKRLWFEIYTNYYNNVPLPFCSGFEHIMVGEEGSGNKIGGYHNWVKFYLDEKNKRIDFRGYNYDGNLGRASRNFPSVPYVVTLSSTWEPKDMQGNSLGVFRKDRGGFFVGSSPELDIAIATVAYFENEANKFSGTKVRNVSIQGGIFDLVLYRSVNRDQTRGDKLRSFYPVFKKPVNVPELPPNPNVTEKNKGDVFIAKALINAEGSQERGKEWVDISNESDKIIDLSGWSILDRKERSEPISGKLEPDKTRRFFLTTPELGNKGGVIKLQNNQDQIIAEVDYNKADEGEVIIFRTE